MKTNKIYTIVRFRRDKETEITKTLQEFIDYFSYTLLKGHSWNRKINKNPKTIASLITNLNNAENAATCNGYSGVFYSLKD